MTILVSLVVFLICFYKKRYSTTPEAFIEPDSHHSTNVPVGTVQPRRSALMEPSDNWDDSFERSDESGNESGVVLTTHAVIESTQNEDPFDGKINYSFPLLS